MKVNFVWSVMFAGRHCPCKTSKDIDRLWWCSLWAKFGYRRKHKSGMECCYVIELGLMLFFSLSAVGNFVVNHSLKFKDPTIIFPHHRQSMARISLKNVKIFWKAYSRAWSIVCHSSLHNVLLCILTLRIWILRCNFLFVEKMNCFQRGFFFKKIQIE